MDEKSREWKPILKFHSHSKVPFWIWRLSSTSLEKVHNPFSFRSSTTTFNFAAMRPIRYCSLALFLSSPALLCAQQPTTDAERASSVTIEKISYAGWPNCYRLSNGSVDLVVTTDVGPRVIRFGFVGEENEFKEYKDQLGKVGGDEWRIYGGHRLWHAPEHSVRTYWPDNSPVEAVVRQDHLRITQPVETTTGIQKEIDLTIDVRSNHVTVLHRLTNKGLWAVELAPWSLTVMDVGGKVVLPQPPYKRHGEELLPLRSMAVWGYTNMADPRYLWGTRYIILSQDPQAKEPTKVGAGVREGWAAYVRKDHLFLKRFDYILGASYPDFGSSVESFTNSEMIELETLGPLTEVQPGSFVEHREDWYLFKGIGPIDDERSVDKFVIPRVRETERH
jgi:hypothetical protein